jgi:hypothetical protein
VSQKSALIALLTRNRGELDADSLRRLLAVLAAK